MADFSLSKLVKSTVFFSCASAAFLAWQSQTHAQVFGNGNFLVPLSDPQVNLSPPVFTNGQVQLTLNGETGVSYVIESSPDIVNWARIATNSDSGPFRTILVEANDSHYFRALRVPRPLAVFALATRGNMNLNGNGLSTDSFNSSDPALSTDGQYDKTKAQTNGTLASVQGIMNVGNHVIGGSVILGKSGQYTSGTNQILGSLYFDQALALPDVLLPNVVWQDAPITGSVHDFSESGYYLVNDASNLVIEPGVTAVLNVTVPTFRSGIAIHGGVTNSGSAYIFLNGCTNATIYRNQAYDASYRARNLCFFGLPSLAFVTIADTTVTNTPCVIYAPSAIANISGGGAYGALEGSIAVASMTMNGFYRFYFDEDLLTNGPCR